MHQIETIHATFLYVATACLNNMAYVLQIFTCVFTVLDTDIAVQ